MPKKDEQGPLIFNSLMVATVECVPSFEFESSFVMSVSHCTVHIRKHDNPGTFTVLYFSKCCMMKNVILKSLPSMYLFSIHQISDGGAMQAVYEMHV